MENSPTVVISIATLVVTVIVGIATVLGMRDSRVKATLLSILGVVSVFFVGVLIWIWTSTPRPPRVETGKTNQLDSQRMSPALSPTPQHNQGPQHVPSASLPNPERPSPSFGSSPEPERPRIAGTPTPTAGQAQQDPVRTIVSEIGETKSNGSYEITLENAKTLDSSQQRNLCGSNVQSQTAVLVRFTIRTLNPYVPAYTRKKGDTDFLILDDEGRRFERVCGDGWYGGGPRTVELVYALPMKPGKLRFRFQNVGHGDAMTFALPEFE